MTSMLDSDLYKVTMMQAMLHQVPGANVTSEFLCRNDSAFPLATLRTLVEEKLDELCAMTFAQDELNYLAGLSYIKPDFITFLRIFRLQRDLITVSVDGDHLRIRAEGPAVHVTLFEIFVLSIVNEAYFVGSGRFDVRAAEAEGSRRLVEKIRQLEVGLDGGNRRRTPFQFFEFGTRRRFSAKWQDHVVAILVDQVPEYFKGTSNVMLAKKYGLTAIGTMARVASTFPRSSSAIAHVPARSAGVVDARIPRGLGHRAD